MFTINMLDRLACSECKNVTLEAKAGLMERDKIIKGELVCPDCDRKYPVHEGIANMLPDELRLQRKPATTSWRKWRKRLGLFRQRMKVWTAEDSRRTIPIYEELFHRFCPMQGSALEVGCGNGVVRYFLNRNVEYWGIDPDKDWILQPFHSFAEDIFPCLKEPFPFIQGVGEYLPFKDESFDNVIIVAALDHVNSPSRVFEECHRVLKDKGIMLLSICAGKPEMAEGHISQYLRKGVQRLLRGELISLIKSVVRKLVAGMEEPDLFFSMAEIIRLFHQFSDLEIKPCRNTLFFFKARKNKPENIASRSDALSAAADSAARRAAVLLRA